MARKKIPVEIQTNVLIKSRRRCAFCFGINRDTNYKRGQIAHIDNNNQNNNEENLVFLCFEHHDEYDSKMSQSKGLTERELKEYKKGLEDWVKKNFQPVDSTIIYDDYSFYLELKKYFVDNDLLSKFKNFIFGVSYPLEFFDIFEGVSGSDLLDFYASKFPPIDFYDKNLKDYFNIFKENFYMAEDMLWIKYQYDEFKNQMKYIDSPYYDKEHLCEKFNLYVENLLKAFYKIINFFE